MARLSQSIFVWQKARGRLSELAVDLVRKRVAAIVANTNATPYAIAATKSIPIVFVTGSDPVAAGFVPKLNHPGGNVTGISFFNEGLISKRLEILHPDRPYPAKSCGLQSKERAGNMNSSPKLKPLPFYSILNSPGLRIYSYRSDQGKRDARWPW